ncbi:carbon-nitrogen hydrolase family protein [Pseudonocardia sp. TMWB2A]|uniref:carbon-nitrogen hydrolase family protein n=1 Tax=Pseudonocardia sp. TMWB2A TaxID=687430 RepID=UPI00307EB467
MTGSNAPFTIALLQMTSGIEPQRNCAQIVAALEEARAGGAKILFAPEMSLLLDRDRQRSAAHIGYEVESSEIAALQQAARDSGLWLHLGSAPFVDEQDGNKRVNRTLVIDDKGVVRARYDKIHLFDVDLATGESWRESSTYTGGGAPVAVDTPWGRLGLSICYDLRFPDLYRALTDAGATMLAIPAAFTVPTGEAHWHILQSARAIEAGVFVIAAAQVGPHEDGRKTYGHSLVIDPWGRILLDMGDTHGVGFAKLDPAEIAKVRAAVPALANRKAIGEVQIF